MSSEFGVRNCCKWEFIFHFSFFIFHRSSYNIVVNLKQGFMRGNVVHAQNIRPGGNGREIRGNGGGKHGFIRCIPRHSAYEPLA